MGVQLVEGKRRAQASIQLVGERDGARFDGGKVLDVGDLFALEKPVPECRADRHVAMVAWPYRGAFGLRSHPSNLIRFVPAKGVETSERHEEWPPKAGFARRRLTALVGS
jgi:hypothetical protein